MITRTLMAASFAVLSSVSHAQASGCAEDPQLEQLFAFVEARIDHIVRPYCLSVEHVPDVELSHLQPAGLLDGQAPAAVFVPSTTRILVDRAYGTDTAIGRGLIVHEIVHAFQFANAKADTAPCHGALEHEAYAIQADYLHQEGQSHEAGLALISGVALGACQSEYP